MTGGAYHLAVAGHKGGTGRSTTAAALAWYFGQAGLPVVLADAAPTRAAGRIARAADGRCHWPNVTVHDGWPPEEPPAAGVVVLDGPGLLEPASGLLLAECDGLLLCCRADPLALWTVPAAAAAIGRARAARPELELLGILIGPYDSRDAVQSAMLGRLRELHGELLLEPPVPAQAEMRDWPLSPGAAPPPGPARDALAAVARTLENWLRLGPRAAAARP
jgi:cellulose biosynthesis protein BcsQ